MGRLEALRQQLEDLQASHEQYTARFDADPNRVMTEEEQKIIKDTTAQFDRLNGEIALMEKMQAQIKVGDVVPPRQTQPDGPASARAGSAPTPNAPLVVRRTAERDRTHGFRTFGDFNQAVFNAAMNPSAATERLHYRADGGQNEGVGADGGFLVPPDFRSTINEKVMAEDTLLGRTDGLTTGSNAVTVPVDEIAQWDETTGVQGYWEGEGRSVTESKTRLSQTQVRLNKLTALVRVTEELMEDAPAIDGYLRRKVPEKFDFKCNMGLVRGTGVGMPLGIMNSGFTVVAASSTAAATIAEFSDLVAMWARMYAPWRSSAIWMIHPEIEERLPQIAFDPDATAGQVPVYLPANSISGGPYSTLFGRPVIPSEVCSAPSDPGDIIFASWPQYMSATKGGGVRTDTSIHVYFDTDEVALRFIMRVGGQPWFKSPIASREGTFERSAFVTLADRT